MIYKRLLMLLYIVMLSLLIMLAACEGSKSNSESTGNTTTVSGPGSTTVAITVTPKQVTPKTARGTAGTGPLVIASPTPVPGGKPESQQVILADRVLIINGVSKQKGASAETTLINLDLSLKNTSSKAIMNQSSFFSLMGSQGDTFAYQHNSTDNFYGTIAAKSTHHGVIVFQVPTAATTSMRLLYRPEIVTETTILPLKI